MILKPKMLHEWSTIKQAMMSRRAASKGNDDVPISYSPREVNVRVVLRRSPKDLFAF